MTSIRLAYYIGLSVGYLGKMILGRLGNKNAHVKIDV